MKSEPRMTTACSRTPRPVTRVPRRELTLKLISARSLRKAARLSLISWEVTPAGLLGRAAQLGSAFGLALGFGRLSLGLGFNRLNRRAFAPGRLPPRRDFGAGSFARRGFEMM